jgi:Fe-S-cluster-containing dehydrogenase component
MEAISLDENEGIARVSEEACIGCGVCLSACDEDALSLERVREADSIPD